MNWPRQVRGAATLAGLALVLCSFGSEALAGTTPETPRFTSPQFGISVMPTLGSFVTSARANDRELGVRVTGQIRVRPWERADLLVGLAYESRAGSWSDYFGYGGAYAECGGTPGYHREVSLEYLLLPIRVRISPMNTRARPFIMVGGEVGLLLGAQESGRNRCNGSDLPTQEVRDGLHEGVAEVVVGVGIAAPVAGRASFIQLNLIEGLSSLEPDRFSVEGSWPEMRSRVLGLELGLWF